MNTRQRALLDYHRDIAEFVTSANLDIGRLYTI